jgi:hypothetical protein
VAERRNPLIIEDEAGLPRGGEVVIVRRWQPQVVAAPDAAFTIVLTEEPLTPAAPAPRDARFVVCGPGRPVRIDRRVAESSAAYGAGSHESTREGLRLTAVARAAFAVGRLLAARPLPLSPEQAFGGASARFDLLARAVLQAPSVGPSGYWRAAEVGLAWPEPAARTPRAVEVRSRLRKALGQIAREDRTAQVAPALVRLRQVVAGEAPSSAYEAPALFADDVALARCLVERPKEAAQVAEMRAYLDAADVPEALGELAVDRAIAREQLSFRLLLMEPQRFLSGRAAFESFRSAYAAAYADHHQAYWQATFRLRRELEEAAPAAQALARLNSLRDLGSPEGMQALVEYDRMAGDARSCSARSVERTLEREPVCLSCRLTLTEQLREEPAQAALRDLRSALQRQQRRLASRAVRRILSRGGERIERFLQIVQASDLRGLADVLDDELLLFLSELLAQELVPAPAPVPAVERAPDLLLELARAHPTVTERQVEAVTQTLRSLLEEALRHQREREGAAQRPVRVRLAYPATEP